MKNNIVISLLVFGLSFLNLQAQEKLDRKAKHKDIKNEMKAYTDTHIKPALALQRAKLDTYLNKREQKEVEQLRIERKDLRTESRAFRKEMKEAYTGPNSLSDDQKKKSRELAKTKRALDTRAWAIVDAHEDQIAGLIEELEPNMETWRKEMQAIKQKNMPGREGSRGDWLKSTPKEGTQGKGNFEQRGTRGKRGGKGFGPSGGRGGMNMSLLKNPVAFLLWDSKEDVYENNTTELSVFPNPTTSSNTLKFTLKERGPLTVSILNERGIVVKTLLQENREAGTYTEKFDLSELEKGLYLYQIKTAEGISTKKLIIEK